MRRPQVPEILVGFRLRFWVLAILMETGRKLSRNWEQQKGRPQMPRPPTILASSRTPICRSSIRARKTEARSRTSSRKSTRPSAVKKKMILAPSKPQLTFTSFISRPWSAIFFSQMSKASLSFRRFRSTVARSASVARRSTGQRGWTTALSSTSWLPTVQVANSRPWAVSTTTSSPIFSVRPLGEKS